MPNINTCIEHIPSAQIQLNTFLNDMYQALSICLACYSDAINFSKYTERKKKKDSEKEKNSYKKQSQHNSKLLSST